MLCHGSAERLLNFRTPCTAMCNIIASVLLLLLLQLYCLLLLLLLLYYYFCIALPILLYCILYHNKSIYHPIFINSLSIIYKIEVHPHWITTKKSGGRGQRHTSTILNYQKEGGGRGGKKCCELPSSSHCYGQYICGGTGSIGNILGWCSGVLYIG